jgi:alpha-L-fucosidase
MNLTRRQALKLLGYAAPALALRPTLAGQSKDPVIAKGKFLANRDSLSAYQIPEWFRDAKFGIWAHWGPQSAIEAGDWYARNMYIQGSDQYEYHTETYGHPSKVGYKDLIPMFTAEKWDPEHLLDLYTKAGAKYFVTMGVHHDNFDMWNSKYQPRWNAVATGPKKDIVGMWRQAARKRGLRFGVSEHLSNSFDWFAPAHTSDAIGEYAGTSYDGVDPKFADLYHSYVEMPADFTKTAQAMGRVAPVEWKWEYFLRIKDLIDQHQPDLLYTDGGIAFDEYGLSLVAELYNVSANAHGGKVESVFTGKNPSECVAGTCTLDRERGVADDIWPEAWQTDTCIGNWHYKRGVHYKSAKKVIDMLVDIVSKNGNLLLNFPLPNSGQLDLEEMQTLDGITNWMAVNSEGIYSTRPWKIYGEGPGTKVLAGAGMNENKKPDLGAADVRFTAKGNVLYAFVQGWPGREAVVESLSAGPQQTSKIESIQLLGSNENLQFKQDVAALRVALPGAKPATADIGIALKITMANA